MAVKNCKCSLFIHITHNKLITEYTIFMGAVRFKLINNEFHVYLSLRVPHIRGKASNLYTTQKYSHLHRNKTTNLNLLALYALNYLLLATSKRFTAKYQFSHKMTLSPQPKFTTMVGNSLNELRKPVTYTRRHHIFKSSV